MNLLSLWMKTHKNYTFGMLMILLVFCQDLQAQSFVFGPKLGPSIAFQRWSGYSDRGALIAYHGAFFIESYAEDQPSSLYAEVGFHKRGSSEFTRFVDASGLAAFNGRQNFQFNNVNLLAGAKRILNMDAKAKPYYILALRGEYTISTNLEQYTQYVPWFPAEELVNKFNYGVTIGGGYQYDFAELVGAAIEITISPDISKQYFQPPLSNVINPWDFGNPRSLPEQQIRNLSFEVSAVLRLKRIVEYR